MLCPNHRTTQPRPFLTVVVQKCNALQQAIKLTTRRVFGHDLEWKGFLRFEGNFVATNF